MQAGDLLGKRPAARKRTVQGGSLEEPTFQEQDLDGTEGQGYGGL